jgi:hypothetical protein
MERVVSVKSAAVTGQVLRNEFHETRIQRDLLFQLYFNVDLQNFYAVDIMLHNVALCYIMLHNVTFIRAAVVETLNH